MRSSITSWQIVNDPLYKKPLALVGLTDYSVVVVIPLHDLRDVNFDGKVSFAERVTSLMWSGFGLKAHEAGMLMSIAIEMADPDLKQIADKKLLQAGFTVGMQQFNKMYLKSFVNQSIGLIIDSTSLNTISKYFVKKGFENVFNSLIQSAQKDRSKI